MVKVLLVDDEVLALNYLAGLINWEEHGCQIVGQATSGKKALELYEKYNPQIVISDIRMIGMDGLELAKRLKEKDLATVVILLSAYKDFEYAQKGIQYGVSNYLLKHEMSEGTLVQELDKAKANLIQNTKKEKIYQTYFVNQLIYNQPAISELETSGLGKRLLLVMIHRNNLFREGRFLEQELNINSQFEIRSIIEAVQDATIYYIADVKISANNQLVLYRIEHTVSKYKVNTLVGERCRRITNALKTEVGRGINLLYSEEIRLEEISKTFQQMSSQIRYSLFWKAGEVYALGRLPQIAQEEKIVWSEELKQLEEAVYKENQDFTDQIAYLFEQAIYPDHKLESLRELIQLLENSLRQIEKKEGIDRLEEKEEMLKVEEIREYYGACYAYLYQKIHEHETAKYSNLVLEIKRFIRKNYRQDLNLELLGDVFQMNGVYLGQVFKKEVGITFLKFLTNCRVEEAKRLLEAGERNITEISEMVGYKTSQYFSQIFIKNVGLKPQEYKKWNEKR